MSAQSRWEKRVRAEGGEVAERLRARGAKEQRARRARLFQEVIEAYGGRCVCCGEDEPMFLTLDHKDGREPGDRLSGHMLYDRVKRDGFPDTFRLLCWNCNCGRARNGGVCPHELTKTEVA